MGRFLASLLANAVALAVCVALIPGVHVVNQDIWTYLVIALIFGLVNAIIRPLVALLSCPLVLVTVGLFILVINGLMLRLTAALSGGRFEVDGWIPAIIAGIVMGLLSTIIEALIRPKQDTAPDYR